MSLITTKSTEGNPASYVNRFKNTFEIHANAEIAVQEVVLNRAHKFVTGPNAKILAVNNRQALERLYDPKLTQARFTLFVDASVNGTSTEVAQRSL